MKPKLSVCIISNMIDDRLYRAIDSFKHPDFEICVGFNGLSGGKINAFELTAGEVKTFDMPWQGYGATKNSLAQKAGSDWILSVDSDEIADDMLVQSLVHLDLSVLNKVYAVQRVQKIGTHRIRFGSFGAPEWKVRLYNKNIVSWDLEKVHEELEIPPGSNTEKLSGTLLHLTAENLAEVKEKNNHYARLSAENMQQRGKKVSVLKPFLAALVAFLKQYFFKKGFLDGRIGWQLARESARYTYLKYNKLRDLLQSAV